MVSAIKGEPFIADENLTQEQRTRIENELLKKRIAEEHRARIESAARAFAFAQIKDRRILPAEADGIIIDYVQAVEDDAISPLGGEDTRVNRLRSQIEARPSHRLTEELVTAGDHKTLTSDPAGDSKTVKAERRKELLEQTSLGKDVLKVVQ